MTETAWTAMFVLVAFVVAMGVITMIQQTATSRHRRRHPSRTQATAPAAIRPPSNRR